MNEMKFAEGMSFKARNENAPETVRGSIYFKVSEFQQFLDKNKDEKGWVHVKMMKSKEKGTIYFILDTWKPTPQTPALTETQEVNNKASQKLIGRDLTDEEMLNMQDIPF